MMRSLPLFVGLRYASAKRGSMLVTFLSRMSVAGLVLGVAMLITVLSVMNGFEKELHQRILKLVPHTMLLGREPIEEWQTLREVIERHPDVVGTAPFIHMQALLGAGRRVEIASVQSVDPGLEMALSNLDQFVESGQFLGLSQDKPGIALGRHLSRRLGVSLGERIRLVVPSSGSQLKTVAPKVGHFEVVAIFHTGTGIDQDLAIINLQAGQNLLGLGNRVQGVRAQTSNVFDTRRISWELVQQLPPGYYTRDWRELHGNLYHSIQLSRRLVTLMIFVVIAVALFNIVSTLVMVVTDKRQDIAILKTMGAGTTQIVRIFFIHGVIIAVLGTTLGVALGCALSLGLPDIVAALEGWLDFQILKTSVYPVDYIPSDLRYRDVAIIAGSAIVMSLIATVYPALRASRVQPAQALRWL